MAGTKHNEQDQNQKRETGFVKDSEHKSDVKKELKDENRTGTEGRHRRQAQR